ncbi:immunoglobulin-like domain-containing protein [Gracilibacillus kekensis]|uniref:Ig-like domain (Group 2) n=1 Tax=Gracilibacillus kekensis TaxID=1027249 RepID=A0A1M7N1K9_9BACI|nr:immunoglobulin-like domain-containing protein [Gracilibacillus kekensis]SHM97398.1 Ig-like domain (group 2) [Gracilibacillus kekensis]
MNNNRNLSILMISVLLFQLFAGSVPHTIQAAEEANNSESSLLLHYDMKQTVENNGNLVFDNRAGSEFNGRYQNQSEGDYYSNEQAGFVELDGGPASDTNAYIEIPKADGQRDLLSDIESVTVTSLVNWSNDGTNRWIYGFGKVDENIEQGNSYLFTTPRHSNGNFATTGISESGWRNESIIQGDQMISANQWNVITSVFNGKEDTFTLYVNGEEIATGSTEGNELAKIIDSSADFSGFIGKSIFQNDAYFKGRIADFRVHGKALTAGEVANLSDQLQTTIDPLNQLLLDRQQEQLAIEPYLDSEDTVDAVTQNLSLPAETENGVALTWDSSHPEVITPDGKVTRPGVEQGDTVVDLSATLSYQGMITTKTFTVTVIKEFSDMERVERDAESITVYNSSNVKGNLHLVTTGENGSDITWDSSHPDIIKGTEQVIDDTNQLGWVERPVTDTEVTLTASVQYNEAMITKEITVTVKKDPGEQEYDAYFFSYFTGEYEGGEEISFAVAEDPLHWRALNNGQSVIQSTMGEKGLRDPFVIRSPEGDKFYMIATDLKMGESTNFDQAQITGSHSIMVWESDDLVNWSEQRMVEVAPENGGNTWAPEAFYHEPTGEYVVFWASSIPNEETYGNYPNGRPNGQYNVMYYATTRDFHTFSEPKVYIDDSFPTIDTTFIQDDESLYRFTKSEVNFKVYYEKATDIFEDVDGIEENGYQFDLIDETKSGNQGLIGHGGNNEGQTIFKAIDEEKWYLFLDSWPYHVRWTDDLEDGSQLVNNVLDEADYALPPGPRHGTVIPITNQEYQALTDKYLPEGPKEQEEPVVHYRFDQSEDGSVTDVSGNGYDAQLHGNATIESEEAIGDSQGFVQLDGDTGYVEMPENLIQQENLEKMTISTWVKVDQNQADQRIFDFGSDTGRVANRNSMYLSTQGDSGLLEFATVTPFTEKFGNASSDLPSDYKYRLTSNRLGLNQWQHVAITIDGFTAKTFVNGELVDSIDTYNVEPRMLMETTMNYLGKSSRDNQSYFAGGIDEFQIYNRALTEQEIVSLADQATEEPPPAEVDLLLDYDMQHVENDMIMDQAGDFDGMLSGINEEQIITTDDVGIIELSGENAYIEMPQGVLNEQESITVSSLVNWNGENAAEWLYTFGQNDQQYLYFTPRYNADASARFGIATDGWRNEVSSKTDTLASNQWKLVTTVFDGSQGTLELYIDGEFVSSEPAGEFTLADIANPTGPSGYIGQSFYSADPYFKGLIADFEVYDGVLSAAEIQQLENEAEIKRNAIDSILVEQAKERLTVSQILGENKDAETITVDLNLPNKGSNNTTITWKSSDPQWISDQGKVIRPDHGEGNKTVTLTATISDDNVSAEKEISVTVLKKPSVEQRLKEALQALVVHNVEEVKGNLTLPTNVAEEVDVTWTTSDSSTITATGEVSRPAFGEGNTDVVLTATLQLDGQKLVKSFKAKVMELPEPEEYQGYFFPYFTGEGYENGEQIYFALSEGNNPLEWQQLNDGNPVFTSELGEKGLRDPFIIRSPEGDTFYMIATDLKIHGNGDWNKAQTHGSRSIMVWESHDLINWSKQRKVEIAPKEAGNTWAPEIFYDETTGEYIVFWASKLYDNDTDRNNGSSYQRMMYTKTRDFHTFSEPEVYLDYGYSIIDTTMIEHDGKFYRFTKDERGYHADNSPNGKFIFQEVGDSVLDPDFEMVKEGIGKGIINQGEGPAIFKSNTEEKWYLFIDEFGGRGYVPFETTDLASGEWTIPDQYDLPNRPRHGTVLPITATEYEALQHQLPEEIEEDMDLIESISFTERELTLTVGEEKQLSVEITPTQNADLLWNSNNEEIVTIDENGKITAIAEGEAFITVSSANGKHSDVSRVVVTDATDPEPSNELENGTPLVVSAGKLYNLVGTKVTIKMPGDLPEGTLLTINEVDVEALVNKPFALAGSMFDFEIVYPDGSEQPTDPFLLTLEIDETKLDDDIAIYYYNETNQEWEIQDSNRNDAQAGTISAEVTHFSIYGVLALETEDPQDNEEQEQPTDPEQPQEPGHEEKPEDGEDKQKDRNNKELPDTATTLFNWLSVGFLLVVAGVGLFLIRNPRYK